MTYGGHDLCEEEIRDLKQMLREARRHLVRTVVAQQWATAMALHNHSVSLRWPADSETLVIERDPNAYVGLFCPPGIWDDRSAEDVVADMLGEAR